MERNKNFPNLKKMKITRKKFKTKNQLKKEKKLLQGILKSIFLPQAFVDVIFVIKKKKHQKKLVKKKSLKKSNSTKNANMQKYNEHNSLTLMHKINLDILA